MGNSQTRDDGKDDIKNDDGKDDIKHDVSNEFKPKINIAIDFGTDGTAIAYSIPGNQDSVRVYGRWKVSTDNGGTIATTKARTAILLDKFGDAQAFGINALRG